MTLEQDMHPFVAGCAVGLALGVAVLVHLATRSMVGENNSQPMRATGYLARVACAVVGFFVVVFSNASVRSRGVLTFDVVLYFSAGIAIPMLLMLFMLRFRRSKSVKS